MIAQLVADGGTNMSEEAAERSITDYINTACEKILDTTAVFRSPRTVRTGSTGLYAASRSERKAIFAQNPRYHRGFLAFMPSSHSARRENAGRSLSLVFRSAAKLSLVHSFLLRGGGFRRRCFPQGNFRSKPTVSPWVFCIYAFLSLYASRKCKTFTLSSFSLRYKTIARSLIFAPRRRLPPLFQGNFSSKPAASPRVSCIYAFLSLYASRKCKTFTLSSFFARCKTIARSLIFAPRRRLPPLFQGNFRSKPAHRRGFLALMPSSHSTRREILLRVPWGMLLPPPSLRAFLPRELTPPKILSAGTPELTPQNIRFAGTPDALPQSQNAGLTFSLYKNF